MQPYRLFEKMLASYRSPGPSTNGKSPGSGEPSPSDSPLHRLARARQELKSVSDEDEETGRFEVSREGLKGHGVPRWAMGIIGAGVSLALLAVAIAYAIKMLK
jgi:hypothetical protein